MRLAQNCDHCTVKSAFERSLDRDTLGRSAASGSFSAMKAPISAPRRSISSRSGSSPGVRGASAAILWRLYRVARPVVVGNRGCVRAAGRRGLGSPQAICAFAFSRRRVAAFPLIVASAPQQPGATGRGGIVKRGFLCGEPNVNFLKLRRKLITRTRVPTPLSPSRRGMEISRTSSSSSTPCRTLPARRWFHSRPTSSPPSPSSSSPPS